MHCILCIRPALLIMLFLNSPASFADISGGRCLILTLVLNLLRQYPRWPAAGAHCRKAVCHKDIQWHYKIYKYVYHINILVGLVGMATSPRFFQQSLLVYPPHPGSSNNLCWYTRFTTTFPTMFVGNLWVITIYQQFLLEIYRLRLYTNNSCWKMLSQRTIPTQTFCEQISPYSQPS